MKGAPKGEGKRCKGEARPLSTYRRYERKEKKEEERERKRPRSGQERSDLPRLEAAYIEEDEDRGWRCA